MEEMRTHSLSRLYGLTLVLAACSLAYELVIAHTTALLAANMVIWYSLTIGVFLGGLGIGALISKKLQQCDQPWRPLFITEIALSAVGALAVPAIHCAHMLFGYLEYWAYFRLSVIAFFGTVFLCSFLVGILTGIELPLLIRLGNQYSTSRRVTNRVLGVDYIGSLIAGLVFPILLVPYFDMLVIGWGIATLNLGAAVLILIYVYKPAERSWRHIAAAGSLAAVLLVAFSYQDRIQQYYLRKYYYYLEASESLAKLFSPMPELPEVLRARSPYQKIDIVKEVSPAASSLLVDAYTDRFDRLQQLPENYYLFLNGDWQFARYFEDIYHEYFTHVPIMLNDRIPRKVLVLGGGDGLLLRELVKYGSIESVTHIDIDRKLIELAKTHPVLKLMNRNAFDDARITTIFTDGFQYMRHTKEEYDAIFIDFPMPADYNLAKLYSREFFTFVRKRIAPGGFVVFDATGLGLLTPPNSSGKQQPAFDNDWPIYYNTLKKAGYPHIVPYVTTLEIDNQEARKTLQQADATLIASPEVANLLSVIRTRQELQTLRRLATRQFLLDHVLSLQQGFIIARNDPLPHPPTYKNFGVEMYVLNRKRFPLAFRVDFPTSEQIDESKVNSILRPTFPTIPIWYARLPF